MKKITKEEQKVQEDCMQDNNLTAESKLYRYTSKDYLKKSNGLFYLEAKKEPVDMVVDRYHGNWQVFIASEIGQGISFLLNREEEYEDTERICVEVNLKDVINQGGLIYEVTSLPAYLKAYFCKLPEGRVKVSIVSD